MDVVLGPALELHTGMHGALLRHPPPAVAYEQRSHRYHYRFRKSLFPPNPFDHLAVDETVVYDGPDPAFVHSCRVPVGNPVAWVVDHDDLVAFLRYGQFFAVGSESRIRSGSLDARALSLRQRTLVSRFLEPRCRAVIFWTEYARRAALEYLETTQLFTGHSLETFVAKTAVVYPALPVLPASHRNGPVHVLCSGRTFEDKGGELAIEVFRELGRRFGKAVRLTLVGNVPATVDAGIVNVVPILPREDYLKLLAQAHIFFSPTSFESFGMALLEAAAGGLAIVTSCGDGMEHVAEMFEDSRHACLIPHEWPRDERIRAYVSAIERLIIDAGARCEMSGHARSLVESGPFSLAARDRALMAQYTRSVDGSLNGGASRPSRRQALEARDFSEEYCWMEIASRRGNGPARIRL